MRGSTSDLGDAKGTEAKTDVSGEKTFRIRNQTPKRLKIEFGKPAEQSLL